MSTLTPTEDPVVIVGMACRLPGDVTSPSKLWDLLLHERSGQCDVPPSRFNIDAFYDVRGGSRPGSMNMTGGYFLPADHDIRAFENDFFGINNMEALYMDPQQRKLLEVVYECLESAGVPLTQASGANIGCYVGNFTVDFQMMQLRDSEYLHRYSATGMSTAILGNRISHALNLKGPSLVLDTACSSSLYGLHIATSALRQGECDAAIVAGANLIQSPEQHLLTMKAGVLSPTSTCHTFAANADGYARADGIGALYLKRLSAAQRDGDPIRAIIRGSAINANGKTPGITLPSADGQVAVMRKAYEAAGLPMDQTAYVECHGTGTAVGDPIEVEAVSRAFGKQGSPILLGSVKSNLGHSEAASGISSVIKATLALENGFIPATVGVNGLNPRIKPNEWNIQVVTKGRSWPDTPIRRMGVNSFGFGGANAHVILEQAPSKDVRAKGNANTFVLPFSGSTNTALQARIRDLATYDQLDYLDIHDLAYTLCERRSHLQERGFLIATRDTLRDSLDINGLQMIPQNGPSISATSIAFVFTGQGAQWPQMGKELAHEFPLFRQTIKEMDSVLQDLPDSPSWSIFQVLTDPEASKSIHDVSLSQPVCTAVQIALTRLLTSWNVIPSAVMGHSSGEIAAAFAAGHISLANAILAAFLRGAAVRQEDLAVEGGMLAAGLDASSATQLIREAGLDGKIRVACVNSPESTTISGDATGIDAMMTLLESRELFVRKLRTGGRAYHSHHMQAVGQRYQDAMERAFYSADKDSSFRFLTSQAVFISSVTGQTRTNGLDTAYWRSNLESPVLFSEALTKMVTDHGSCDLVELGPHSALELPIKQTLSKISKPRRYGSALVRNRDGVQCMLTLAGRLWLQGHAISLSNVNRLVEQNSSVIHDLPPYRWTYDESSLWKECRASSEFRHRPASRHELLGSRVPGSSGLEYHWRNVLRLDDLEWLQGSRRDDHTTLPESAGLAMILEAVRQVFAPSQDAALEVADVRFPSACVLQSGSSTEIFTVLRPAHEDASQSTAWKFAISTGATRDEALVHATGTITLKEPAAIEDHISKAFDSIPMQSSASRIWYEKMKQEGIQYTDGFRAITEAWIPVSREQTVCSAHVRMPHQLHGEDGAISSDYYPIHPVAMDAIVQSGAIATAAGQTSRLRGHFLTSIRRGLFMMHGSALEQTGQAKAEAFEDSVGKSRFDAGLVDSDGRLVAHLETARLQVHTPGDEAGGIARHPMLRVAWKPELGGLQQVSPKHLMDYVQQQPNGDGDLPFCHEVRVLLDLLIHRNPRMRILDTITEDETAIRSALQLCHAGSDYRRLQSYTTGRSDKDTLMLTSWDLKTGTKGPDILASSKARFDLILCDEPSIMKEFLAPDGFILGLSNCTEGVSGMEQVCIARTGSAEYVRLLRQQTLGTISLPSDSPIVVIEPRGKLRTPFFDALQDVLPKTFGKIILRLSFDQVSTESIPQGAILISLLESETSFLASVTDYDMRALKVITDRASVLLWITSGDLLRQPKPDFAVSSGLSRALMLEQPLLRFLTVDVDDLQRDTVRTASNIARILAEGRQGDADSEYIEKDGVVHISRFVPDDGLNRSFRRKQGSERIYSSINGSQKSLELVMPPSGKPEEVYFQHVPVPSLADLGPFEIKLEVHALGLDKPTTRVLTGSSNYTGFGLLGLSGIVRQVGPSVMEFEAGDQVVAIAPGPFQTTVTVPQRYCAKVEDTSANACSGIVDCVSALYALETRAQLEKGESLLVHDGCSTIGQAVIQLGLHIGADVYATVSTETQKQLLQNAFPLLQPCHIIDEASFVSEIMAKTAGQGVDVVLNAQSRLVRSSWESCGSFGRYIHVFSDGAEHHLDLPRDSQRNITFMAINLASIFHSKNCYGKLPADLVYRGFQLHSYSGFFRSEVQVFDISQFSNAINTVLSSSELERVIVSIDHAQSIIPVSPPKYQTQFDASKSYVMVGCLGGLGSSLAKWMMTRGVRRFVFLGRTGADRPKARELISRLEAQNAQCQVVRGDVRSADDVQRMVNGISGPIGGIVQAAMGLHESLFTTMSNASWHTGIDPKVHGTWNLHHALAGRESNVDFFLMMSSVSGSVGTATESNYCAGNHFLDYFARYRRALGLQAVAVGLGMISEVGYLHDNPEIEALLLRRGIQAINEDEMLQIIDVALSSGGRDSHNDDDAHILTGLEPFGLLNLRRQGFNVTSLTYRDPRAGILTGVLEDNNADASQEDSSSSSDGLPAVASQAIKDGASLAEAVCLCIAKQFGTFLLMPVERVDTQKALSAYGMDSMIAAEFRAWLVQTFQLDVSFPQLLGKTATVRWLVELVIEGMKSE